MMSDVPIEWRPGHPGSQNRHGYVPSGGVGKFLVARVIWRGVGGPNDGPWWSAHLVQDRLPGQHPTRYEACRAAEQAYAQRPPRLERASEPKRWRPTRNRPT